MIRQERTTGKRVSLVLLGLGALLWVLPAGAQGDRDRAHRYDKYDRHHRHEARHVRERRPRAGDYCVPRGSRRAYERAFWRLANTRHHAAQHRAEYRCEPCSKRFSKRSGFHRHLTSHHHVPTWRLPFVVVHHALGWIFYG